MGRPHAESDSYYAAHYNRCVKEEEEEEGEEREDICRCPWNVVKCRRAAVQVLLLSSERSSKNFCLTMTISRQQRNGPHQLLQGAPLSPRETHCAVGHARLTRSILKPNYQRNPCNGGIAFHRFDPIKLFRVFSSQGAIF